MCAWLPSSEKWDRAFSFPFFFFFFFCFSFSRRLVIVGLWWRKGWRLGGLRETSPSLLPLTKTLILHNYTDGLKYTARQGITPIMQSWLKPGPHARALQGYGRGQGLCQWRAENRKKKKKRKPQRPKCRGAFLCFYSLQLESSNIQFDGPLKREKFLVLTEGKVHMFGSRCLLTKTNDLDRRFSLADGRSRCNGTAHHPEHQCSVCVEFTGKWKRGEGGAGGRNKNMLDGE